MLNVSIGSAPKGLRIKINLSINSKTKKILQVKITWFPKSETNIVTCQREIAMNYHTTVCLTFGMI